MCYNDIQGLQETQENDILRFCDPLLKYRRVRKNGKGGMLSAVMKVASESGRSRRRSIQRHFRPLILWRITRRGMCRR